MSATSPPPALLGSMDPPSHPLGNFTFHVLTYMLVTQKVLSSPLAPTGSSKCLCSVTDFTANSACPQTLRIISPGNLAPFSCSQYLCRHPRYRPWRPRCPHVPHLCICSPPFYRSPAATTSSAPPWLLPGFKPCSLSDNSSGLPPQCLPVPIYFLFCCQLISVPKFPS